MLWVTSAFSLSMVLSSLGDTEATVSIRTLSVVEARQLLSENRWESAIGHESTAKVVSKVLGVEVPAERRQVRLEEGDKVLVFQLLQRLPEGKVLGEEELAEVVRNQKWRFVLVEVERLEVR
ncbi:MAG: STIV orfB116 family protein [Candidatus Methanospirareceae archaeon]